METVFGADKLKIDSDTVATIGTFDGVHLGHQEIIKATVEAARREGLPSLLITFDIHPRQALTPERPVEALTSLEDKLVFIEKCGLDYVCILEFKLIRTLSASDFYKIVLREQCRVAHLFVGANFRFGAGAVGDPTWLERAGKGIMEVTEFPLAKISDTAISSTEIRKLLRAGEVGKIPRYLGRNISLPGTVVKGHGRGAKKLGWPTANLEFDDIYCPPGKGVYIGYLEVGRDRLPSVINCGNNPTFGGETFSCEAHVLDYSGDLLGRRVRLELAARLRGERKFPSLRALSGQIAEDVKKARDWFKER